jgi:hypothetical protein
MNAIDAPTRRAAALLIVLATLIVVATATTLLASSASSLVTRARVDDSTLLADDLLQAAEHPIQDWLATKSAKVALPPDALSPQMEVLHDRVNIGGVDCELQISAWDQCGMIPIALVRNGSPLRQLLDANILEQVDALQMNDSNAPVGLDCFVNPKTSDGQIAPSAYPTAAADSDALIFGIHESPAPVRPNISRSSNNALGALIATHNAEPSRINVNTAPLPLVESALRLAGRGGLDQIIESRRQGKLASVAGQASANGSVDPQLVPQLDSKSDRWSFRIDARVGTVRKSWWAVYLPVVSAKPIDKFHWMCVQRLVINY